MIFIKRIIQNDKCTIGKAKFKGFHFWTLEPPKKDTGGRIKTGVYAAWRDHTGEHQGIRLEDRAGRTNIELHVGNYPEDTEGCILPGLGKAKNNNAVWNSQKALDKILEKLERDNLKVRIENKFDKTNKPKGVDNMNLLEELKDQVTGSLVGGNLANGILGLVPEDLIKNVVLDGIKGTLDKINENQAVQQGAKELGQTIAAVIPGKIELELVEFLNHVIEGVKEFKDQKEG